MINTIISDIGGVIIGSGKPTGYAFKDLLTIIGIDEKEFREFFSTNIDLIRISNQEKKFWELLIRKHNLRFSTNQLHDLSREVFSKYIEQNNLINYNAIKYFEELNHTGIKLMALSNTLTISADVYRKLGVYKPFDTTLLSCETGLLKPAIEFFEHGIKISGANSENIIFIDDKTENLNQASILGMQTLLIDNPRNTKQLVFEMLENN